MRKTQEASTEEAPDLNYKQIAKVKYLTQQCRELATLRNLLEDVSTRSKSILQMVSTARMSRQNEPKLGRQFDELQALLMKTRDGLEEKRKKLEQDIIHADRNKKEDQLLYRRILQSYEEKIGELKDTVLNREAYIQRLEKDRRQNKRVVLDKKLLVCNQANAEQFFKMKSEMDAVAQLARQNLTLKVSMNADIQEIHKLENVLTKLKMAKETRMPYYKFRDIMKNGIERMSNDDREEYEFLMDQTQKHRVEEGDGKPEMNGVSSQNLYLILKKEELNGRYLKEMIAEQVAKQEALQEQNAKFKEAIRQIEEQQMCKEIGHRIDKEVHEFRASRWQSMSQTPSSRLSMHEKMNPSWIPCSPEEYKMFLNNMAQNLKAVISELFFLRMTKVKKRAKSQEVTSRLWPKREQRVPQQPAFKESFYQKCDNFITERFYEDIEDVSY